MDRILRQRNALLKQAGGRLSAEIEATLDVWDAKLVEAGGALAQARIDLLTRLDPVLADTYRQLAGHDTPTAVVYDSGWTRTGLEEALVEARRDDVRRGVTTVGPHRDDLAISLNELPARTHASQGEQRCLALALRLAVHRVVTEAAESAPVLLLDDVFSELDPDRSEALIAHLPSGQTILTTAGGAPGAFTRSLFCGWNREPYNPPGRLARRDSAADSTDPR